MRLEKKATNATNGNDEFCAAESATASVGCVLRTVKTKLRPLLVSQ